MNVHLITAENPRAKTYASTSEEAEESPSLRRLGGLGRAITSPTHSTHFPPFSPVVAAFSAVLAALLSTLAVVLTVTGPALAASYRDVKSVRYGTCLYAYGDPLEDIYAEECSTTPLQYGNWRVTNAGYYNNHPLWIITRQNGRCMGVLGTAANNYLYSSCTATNSRDVWEVFTTSSNRYVLKSFGAYQSWGQHKCLTFDGAYGRGRPQLGSCSLTSTADMIYR